MYTYNKEGRVITYYMIFKMMPENTIAANPTYIVENKDIAIAFCENNPNFYFTEVSNIFHYDEK